MSTWKTAKAEGGWLHEELVGDAGWDGYRVSALPGTPLPAPRATRRPAPPRPLVLPAGCIGSCTHDSPHERWECELLATTDEDWARILHRPLTSATGRPLPDPAPPKEYP